MSETVELTRPIHFILLRYVAFLLFGFAVRPAFISAFGLFSEFVHLRRQCLVCRGQLLDGARRLARGGGERLAMVGHLGRRGQDGG